MPSGFLTGASIIFSLTLIASLVGLFTAPALIERSLLRPYYLLRRREFGTLIASGFVHADVPHLIFNLLTFYFFAFALERHIGSVRFVLLYFAGLLCSDIGTYLKHRDNPDYASLGASGAISAVLFASIVYFPGQSLFILPIPFPIPAPLFAVGYLAYTYYSARHSKGRINHDAHLGGALTGLVFVALTEPRAYGDLIRMITG
ncbi:MAG TPA: rhomboid family intramembrane serine protease [Steroidobacteraceae bacterium]